MRKFIFGFVILAVGCVSPPHKTLKTKVVVFNEGDKISKMHVHFPGNGDSFTCISNDGEVDEVLFHLETIIEQLKKNRDRVKKVENTEGR